MGATAWRVIGSLTVRPVFVAIVVVVATIAAGVAFLTDGHHRAKAAVVAPPPSTASPSTTTTVDPGALGQTTDRPTGTDPAFQSRMATLWTAIASGQVAQGLPAFFPLAAYRQVKAVADPGADWQHRLVAEYFADISRVHASLGAGAATARLVSVTVPDAAATWVRPGSEVNKVAYWRVYDSTISYVANGVPGSVIVISLISWRGQWYVVHFRTRPS